MDPKELNRIMCAPTSEKVLRSTDIPSLDLYLDQILTLVADKTGKDASTGGLTKTMINNYSKDGLLKPVKGKKYSKEHIVQMMIIFYLKGVLTIGDIKRIFDGVYSDEAFTGDDLISSYDRFIDIKATEGELCSSMIEHLTKENGLDPDKTDEFLIMLMSIISVCDCLKTSALEMISAKYPPIEKSEKPKEKKSKKENEE
ncbi:MAG: DUF1836 domain-containing protein [Clostridia bacterium]|nr:DUF1836 domain-containing protein [Clostridia bacterium]